MSNKRKLDDFYGPNAGYVLELYERYRQSPDTLDEKSRKEFEGWDKATGELLSENGRTALPKIGKIAATVQLAWAIREYGHLAAKLNPLESRPELEDFLGLSYYGLMEDDLRQLPADLVSLESDDANQNALIAIEELRSIYSSFIGFEFEHIRDQSERQWLHQAAESRRFQPKAGHFDSEALLVRLTEVEAFEKFLHRIFPGRTRFSAEGLDMLIPILDQIVAYATRSGRSPYAIEGESRKTSDRVSTVLIGMAHRGRLNVLAHILECPYEQILVEFKDPDRSDHYDSRHYRGWTGDVKYHAGASREIDSNVDLTIYMPANPSHLEHVNPVVSGIARALSSNTDEAGQASFDPCAALPILIHGDAAFAAQGVVAESLNLSRLPGYEVGGTIHIIANNQIGFTTRPENGRSSLYASDLAKGFEIPVVHVNADHPLACLEAARIAIAYRQKFGEDFLINLIGYRRHGHNEGDEPRFTQPVLYRLIEQHDSVRKKWAHKLVSDGQIEEGYAKKLFEEQMDKLRSIYDDLKVEGSEDLLEPNPNIPPEGAAKKVETAVPKEQLRNLNASLVEVPESFHLHPKLARGMEDRRLELEHAEENKIEWASAENLAFATILAEGIAIRLTGEDTQRGTFSQRHAVFHDTESGKEYIPLQNLPQAKASFEVINSPLSESAVVGFEYGYSLNSQKCLVIWEAQYGDFVNGAQAMIEEFVISAKDKWGQTSDLTILLPHGFEGQGPDHSTGRIESFLQLAAYHNIRVAYPTTAAQYFHLLRRQALLLEEDPLPLFVMTPKSLLRHPRSKSSLEEIAGGMWQPVIDDPEFHTRDTDRVRRLVLCSGKIYVDMVDYRQGQEEWNVALTRVEQLYAFPEQPIKAVLDNYPNLEEVAWVQEEPANMGAWRFVEPCLRELIDGRLPLNYIGRRRRASPAEGSYAWHKRKQQEIVKQALVLE